MLSQDPVLPRNSLPIVPKVLIIEDERAQAELVRWQLLETGEHDFEIVIVNSLAEAARKWDHGQFEPDVILLDLNLPDSRGTDTVARCRAMTEAPIVVLTGLDDQSVSAIAIDSGAEDYIEKGASGSVLRRAIRYAMLRHARDADARLATAVFVHAREAIVIANAGAKILDVNDSFERITGYRRDEVVGRNPRVLASGRHPASFFEDMWRSLNEQGYWYGEVWNRNRGGELFAAMLTISVVKDARGGVKFYVGLFSDVTAQKEHARQLEYTAHYDSLTGLANRVLLRDRMLQSMAQCRRLNMKLAVGFIDLDGFKQVNDLYGHAVGDDLLVAVAKNMRDALREGDTLARLGGDEFVAVLTNLSGLATLEPVLQRLLASLSGPITVGRRRLAVSASIGVSVFDPESEEDADLLLRQADQAMYQAKQAGKARYVIFERPE